MCGRTACTLAPEDVQKACCYRNSNGKFEQPKWKDGGTGGRSYAPSSNIAPTSITPVLVAGSHFKDECKRVVQPMMWGIVPPWHKGSYKTHGLSTNNCRLENLEKSKLYKTPFLKGQRCVVVCEGFYEWQTTKGKKAKQPYFIYVPQENGLKIENPNSWSVEFNEDNGWKGPNLLKMAALFDTWTSPEGDEIFSYSIITMESNSTLSWLHHRMPAILDTEELLDSWLDHGRVQCEEALQCCQPATLLVWHPVSSLVNNSRNQSLTCHHPVDIKAAEEKKTSKSAMLMTSWLKRGNVPKQEQGDDEPEAKTSKKL